MDNGRAMLCQKAALLRGLTAFHLYSQAFQMRLVGVNRVRKVYDVPHQSVAKGPAFLSRVVDFVAPVD